MPIKSTFPMRLLRHGSSWRRGSSDDDQRSLTETAVSSVAPASGPGAQTDRLSSCVRKGADTYTKGSSAAACALCEALVELDHLVHKGGSKELSSLVSVYDRVARGVLLCCEHPAEGAGGSGCARSVEMLTKHVENAKKLAATLCVKRRLARLSTSKQQLERELRNLTDELHMFATHHTPELATDESGYERNRVAYLAGKVKVPSRAPRIQAWYIPRSETVEDVCARLGVCSGSAVGDLGDHEEPRMVGLAGPTGCGKSTVTSLVVAREDVRAYFRDGIVWLPVRGKGAEHRLPDLMLLLANMVYETVLKSGEASWSSKKLRPPRTPGGVACDRENGAAYIRGALGITCPGGEEGDGGGGSHEQRRWRPRYLIVADDVYEPEVLEELQGIGAWVLYTTTRSASFIRRNGERSDGDGDGDGGDHADVLRLDNISDAEGETVLRRASGLDPEAELPQPALDLIKSYGSVVMDLAYIGRWGVVHGTTDVKAWEMALNSVFLEGGEGGQEWTRRRWHTAVLFAGMADLARLNDKAKDLYLSLAVLPKGLSFTPTDAAALLFGGDTKAAKAATPDLGAVMEVLGVLEQCSVLFLEEGGRYCMHGSHADFIRELISCFPLSRKRALGRWREHASTPAALFAWPVEDSVRIQWALSSLDDAVEPPPPPPYDAMLNGMDQSDADTFSAVLERVAQVQALAGNLEGAHAKYTRLVGVTESRLEREAAGGGDSISQAGAELLLADRLHNLGMIAGGLGSTEEAFACHGRARSIREERLGASHPDAAHSLQALAACAAAAGKPQDEDWYLRRALSSWTGEGEDGEGGGGGGGGGRGSVDLLDRWDVARTLHTLGGNSLKAGRSGEATELFRRALRWWEDALGQGCTNAARALHSLGVCAYDAGEVGEAAEFYRRALRVRVERLGPRHPDVAVTMHSLGVCEWKAGRPDEAEVLYQQTLSIRVEALGVEHPHVARTLHSLGGCARHAGRDGDAMALYQRALDIQEAMLGPCHPEVAATLHEMGVSAFGAGRMEQAESHFRRALSIKELTAGAAGGPGTFTLDMAYTLHDLGGVIFAFGDSRVAEAEEVFLRALEIRESLEASLDAASTLQCLAECARARGSGDGDLVSDNRSSSDGGSGGGSGGSAASQEGGVPQRLEEGFLRRALAIQERELGRDHVYVAYTLFQLGRCLCSAAPAAGDGPKTEEGLAAFARSLEVRERELGRNHVDVLRTLHYLAACVSAAGRVGEAAEYYRRAVATEELTLGAEHPSVARSLHLFGACVLKAGRIDEGIELLRRALAIPEKQEQEEEGEGEEKAGGNSSRSGGHHLDVALTMQQVAVCAADAGRTEDADALFREVLAIEERKLGADHLDVADTLSNLGECALKAGRTNDATEYYERALKIEEDKFGADQPVLGSTLHHLGLCAEQDGRTDEAEELFRRALAIEEKQMGADHPNVAATLAGLGANALASGKKEEAESMLKRALAITDKAGGCGSSDGGGYSGEVSTGPPTPPAGGGSEGTLHTLAECARKNGNYEDALRLLERALKIEEGGDDRGGSPVAAADAVLATLRKLASWAGEAGRDGEAEAWYRRVLALEVEELGEGHRDVATTLVLLGRCLSRGQARVEEAANLYRRALEIVEEEEGDRSLQVTSILLDIGLCALMLGRVEEAEVLYTRARTIEAEHLGGGIDEVQATALTLEMFVPRAPI